MRLFLALLVATSVVACTRAMPVAASRVEPLREAASPGGPEKVTEIDIEKILLSDRELAASAANAERLRLQVLVAVPDGNGGLVRTGFRVDREYFYPASAVKLCAAVGALDKLGELKVAHGDTISPTSGVRYVSGTGRSRKVLTTTLKKDIDQSLGISSNDAFNRLLEFVGPEELAERLARRGITSAHVAHRLGDVSSWSSPIIELLLPKNRSVPIGQRLGFPIPSAPKVSLGRAYLDDRGRVIHQPMDFGNRNAMSLRELQDLLVGVVRPELTPTPSVWELPFRSTLVETLGALPSELEGVRGPSATALDTKFKSLAVVIRETMPDQAIRVYGKSGRAYGFAVENAYVTSERSGRSFFVAATIYANGNGMMNDDRYEWETVAEPFVNRLGVVLAQRLLTPPDARED